MWTEISEGDEDGIIHRPPAEWDTEVERLTGEIGAIYRAIPREIKAKLKEPFPALRDGDYVIVVRAGDPPGDPFPAMIKNAIYYHEFKYHHNKQDHRY